jgi:heme ABC exporter ATP-binding subunit CcmA
VISLTVKNLCKGFASIAALDKISFALEGGTCLAVLGENGAGKSTLLNCAAGILRADCGSVEPSSNRRPGYLAHKSFLYDDLTVEENLEFWAELSGVRNKDAVIEIINTTGLKGRMYDKVRTLSAGLQKRVSLGRAVIGNPEILLLDEPYSAFDSEGIKVLRSIIADFKQNGKIVVMATHFAEQAMQDCTHIAKLKQGRLAEFYACDSSDIAAGGAA